MKKSCLIISIVLAVALLGVTEASEYTSHAPIRILGDRNFRRENGVRSGSGTKEDPYIIESLEIDATGHEFGTYVENTTAHFIIRDSKVYGANQGDRWQGNGIYFYNVQNGRIENCEISGSKEKGIALYDSFNNTISGNMIVNNDQGIYLEDSPNSDILENTVEMNMRYGMYLVRSSDTTVAQNAVNSNKYGIRIYFSSRDIVLDNSIANNEIGLFLDKSSNNTVWNNTIERNIEEGIDLWRSTSNSIFGNVIQKNIEYGIKAWEDSTNNMIYQNTFVGNDRNARDEGASKWDNGFKGNFWDDYTGIDADGDGIGDAPYMISGGSNQDRYPLMEARGERG